MKSRPETFEVVLTRGSSNITCRHHWTLYICSNRYGAEGGRWGGEENEEYEEEVQEQCLVLQNGRVQEAQERA